MDIPNRDNDAGCVEDLPVERVDYLILDLATLRYQRDTTRSTVTATTARGEILGIAELTDLSGDDHALRLAAHAALEAALERGRLRVAGSRRRIALYNPHTAEISIGAGSANRRYGDRSPIAVAPDGTAATLVRSELGTYLELAEDGTPRIIREATVDIDELLATWAAARS